MIAGAANQPVLIVDDNPDVRDSLEMVLQLEGYQTAAAADGQAALDALHLGLRPFLILLDLSMPVMDGRTFRRKQLNDRQLAGIPVVIFSADEEVQREAAQLHADGYCQKPADLDTLLKLVEKYYGRGDELALN